MRPAGLLRRACPVLVAVFAGTALLAPIPAHAALLPTMSVTIVTYSTYHRVCADATSVPGSVNVFTFTIAGARSDLSVIAYLPAPTTGSTFHNCQNITTATMHGDYQATLTVAGTSGEAPFAQVGNGSWLNGVDRVIVTSGG